MSLTRKILLGVAALVLLPFVPILVAIAAVMFLLDFCLRPLVLVDNPEFKWKQRNDDNRHLTVFLPGAINYGETNVVMHLDLLKERGDVLVVNYGAERFVPQTIIDHVVHAISDRICRDGVLVHHYESVDVIGASRGAEVACRAQLEAHKRNPGMDIAAIFFDGLPSPKFLKDPLAKIPGWAIFPFGPIWNLLSRILFKAMYIMPEWDKLGPGHDRAAIERNLEAIANMKLSVLHDQMRSYDLPEENAGLGLKAVYLQSGRDLAVKHPDSAGAFKKVYGDGLKVVELPDVTHTGGLLEFPEEGRRGLQEAATHLG